MKKRTVDRSMFYGATPIIFERANVLRNNMTEAEKILWGKLNRKQIPGWRFKAQHPIAQFIVDFYCHKVKLVIEIDGSIHEENEIKERDENRTVELEKLGLKVIRFTNNEILNDIETVINKIKKYLN